jgi:hypothetical protein
MRWTVMGALAGAGVVALVMALLDQHAAAQAQRPTVVPQPVGGDLIALPMPVGEKGQLLTVLDPRLQTIAVYWIEAGSGKIALRSVRNIRYDLQLLDFNSDNPLPREIRLQLEHSLR